MTVTRCPICDRQRQDCDKCGTGGLVPDAHGKVGTCPDCLGKGVVWIKPAFRVEFVEGRGVQVRFKRCPDCEEGA